MRFQTNKKVKMDGFKLGQKVLYRDVEHRIVGIFLEDGADNPFILNGFEQNPDVFNIKKESKRDETLLIYKHTEDLQYSTYANKDELTKIGRE